jgi:hypothetical protein
VETAASASLGQLKATRFREWSKTRQSLDDFVQPVRVDRQHQSMAFRPGFQWRRRIGQQRSDERP